MLFRKHKSLQAVELGLSVILAALATRQSTAASGVDRHIGIRDREVLGVVLGKATAKQVAELLGPAREMKGLEPEITKTCYVSEARDHTTLEIYYWTDPVAFTISRPPMADTVNCHPNRLVSPTLSTASGLRLGMSAKQVIAILGWPSGIYEDEFVYSSHYRRAETPRELAQGKRAGLSGDLLGPVHVYDRVQILFSNSRVVRIAVEHDETI